MSKPEPTSEQKAIMLLGERLDLMEHQLLSLSQELAEREHGPEAVAVAEATAKKYGKLASFAGNLHPYGSLMKWYQEVLQH